MKGSPFAAFADIRLDIQPLWADILRVVALVSMIVDHAARVLYPGHQPELSFLIGRLAFPLFLIVFSIHAVKARTSHARRCLELALFAVVAQPIFGFAVNRDFQAHGFSDPVNILFVFFALSCIFWGIDRIRMGTFNDSLYGGLVVLIFIWFAGFFLMIGGYAWFGLLAGLGFHLSARFTILWLPLALIPMLGFYEEISALMVTFFTVLIAIGLCLHSPVLKGNGDRRFLPKRFFIVSYLGHLAVLGAIGMWVHHATI